jgi:hypothetical protein
LLPKKFDLIQLASNGRNERIRTSDPLVPNEVRYQTALHSDAIYFIPDELKSIRIELAANRWLDYLENP